MLNVQDPVLLTLAAHTPGLVYLSLSGCKNVTDEGLRILSGTSPELTHLDLTRLFAHSFSFTVAKSD